MEFASETERGIAPVRVERIREARDPLTAKIIGAAIEVHRSLGPGLIESIYEECLCYELNAVGVAFRRQVVLPVKYKELTFEAAFRADLIATTRFYSS